MDEDFFSDKEHISAEELICKLNELIEKVKNDNLQSHVRQDIYDSIEEYLTTNKSSNIIDPKTLSYLVRGWWLSSIIEGCDIENLSKVCPICIREIADGSSSETEKRQRGEEEIIERIGSKT